MKYKTNIDLDHHSIQNVLVDPRSSPPTNPKEGQAYYDLSLKGIKTWDGSKWIGGVVGDRVVSVTESAVIVPNVDLADVWDVVITGSSVTLSPPIGTPLDGQRIVIRIRPVVGCSLAYNAIYMASWDLSLPDYCRDGKVHYLGFRYCAPTSKWHFVSKVFDF
jgi:hypothetical protein